MKNKELMQALIISLAVAAEAALAQDETLQCRQRAMYDYCSATMVALSAHAAGKGKTEISKQALDAWKGLMGPWADIEPDDTRQKAAIKIGLERFSTTSVAACIGKDKGAITEIARIAMEICK